MKQLMQDKTRMIEHSIQCEAHARGIAIFLAGLRAGRYLQARDDRGIPHKMHDMQFVVEPFEDEYGDGFLCKAVLVVEVFEDQLHAW